MKLNVTRVRRYAIYVSIIVYVFLLSNILLFKYVSIIDIFNTNRTPFRSVNLIPFRTILSYLGTTISLRVAIMNVLGNIVIFIPLGIYLQLLMKRKKILISAVIVLLVSAAVEIAQYILGVGSSDIDDIILNLLGGITGIGIYRCIRHFCKNVEKLESAIFCSLVLMGLASVLILARYYPQVMLLNKSYKEVIEGEDYYVDFRKLDVNAAYVKYKNGVLTVNNLRKALNKTPNKYSEYDKIIVEVDSKTKMSKLYIDYNYSSTETLLKYEKLTEEDLKLVKPDTAINFNIFVEDGKWKARDLCVTYTSEETKQVDDAANK